VFLDELLKVTFAHDRIGDAQTSEFDLTRLVDGIAVVDDPLIQRTVILIFEAAQ
jgi:hypothetical protein